MSVTKGVMDGVEAIVSSVATLLGQSALSYTDLQTADSEYCLVTNDGALVSIIDISGVIGLVGDDEYKRIHEQRFQALNSARKDGGHPVNIHLWYNQDQVTEKNEEKYDGARKTAKQPKVEIEAV